MTCLRFFSPESSVESTADKEADRCPRRVLRDSQGLQRTSGRATAARPWTLPWPPLLKKLEDEKLPYFQRRRNPVHGRQDRQGARMPTPPTSPLEEEYEEGEKEEEEEDRTRSGEDATRPPDRALEAEAPEGTGDEAWEDLAPAYGCLSIVSEQTIALAEIILPGLRMRLQQNMFLYSLFCRCFCCLIFPALILLYP